MELRQLRYFAKIAELGSLTRASRALHIAQPALSQQMAQLEAEFGQKLLTRLSSGVRMTEQGEVFLRHAQRVLRQIDDIPAAVASLEKSPAGTVRVGLPQTTAAHYALLLAEQVVERFPAIRLELYDEISSHIPARLDSGRFDLGVIVNDEDAVLLDSVPLMDEQLFLVSRAGHAPRGKTVSAAQLAKLPLSIPAAGFGVRPIVDAFLAQAGLVLAEPQVLANSMNIMRSAMMAGHAHGVMPWAAVAQELAAGTLVATPIAPALARRVHLCTARDTALSLAAHAVHRLLADTVHEQVRSGAWQGATLP
ncbi:MAG: LysR substrate-binding domain-containing protein [Pseudomonadota bacterium]